MNVGDKLIAINGLSLQNISHKVSQDKVLPGRLIAMALNPYFKDAFHILVQAGPVVRIKFIPDALDSIISDRAVAQDRFQFYTPIGHLIQY